MASEPYYVSPGDPVRSGWANSVVSSLKEYSNITPRRKQWRGGGSSLCSFGYTFRDKTDGNKLKISGGVVVAGDKNFPVPPLDINVDNARNVYLWFDVPVTVNLDDDAQLMLPGVDTSAWTPKWEQGPTYPDSTPPTLDQGGGGSVIIALGFLSVTSSKTAVWTPDDCGDFIIDHCGGTLSYKRI